MGHLTKHLIFWHNCLQVKSHQPIYLTRIPIFGAIRQSRLSDRPQEHGTTMQPIRITPKTAHRMPCHVCQIPGMHAVLA